ncbi:uncharacterized protein ACMZJ9_009970 [Mantella aurantiaca]
MRLAVQLRRAERLRLAVQLRRAERLRLAVQLRRAERLRLAVQLRRAERLRLAVQLRRAERLRLAVQLRRQSRFYVIENGKEKELEKCEDSRDGKNKLNVTEEGKERELEKCEDSGDGKNKLNVTEEGKERELEKCEDSGDGKNPELEVVAPATHNALIGSTTLVPCSFKVDKPPINLQFLAILWQYGEKELVRYDNKGKYATPRMSIDEGKAKQGNASLTIHNVTIADQGTFKCLVIYSPNTGAKEIQVNIHAVPMVTLLKNALSKNEENHLICLITNFFPKDITVIWLRNGQALDGSKLGSYDMDADGTYRVNSSLTISSNQSHNHPIITCQVEHMSLLYPIQDAFAVQYGAKVTMYCTASNCPDKIQATWTVIEKTGEKLSVTDPQIQSDGERGQLLSGDYVVRTQQSETDGLYNAITSLTFTPTIIKHCNMKVACSFLSNGRTKKQDKEWSFIISKPCLLTPLKMFLGDNGDVVCSVTLEKFFPKNIQIKWRSGVGNYQELNTANENFMDNSDCTFKCESECRVPGHLFQDPGFRVRVMWEHQSLDQPESREVTATDFPWRPVMGDITIPSLEPSREAKLECVISGYFPNSLEVKWLRREAEKSEIYEVSSSDKYKIPVMDIKQEFDKTYTCIASLIVLMSTIRDQGMEFICRVRHPSLTIHQEKRTGELKMKGKPVIKRIFQRGRYIALEIDGFYTQDLMVTWGESDKQYGQYKRIEEKRIQSNRGKNSDDSCSLTSVCDAMTGVDLINPMDKYVKAIIKLEALEFATNIFFLRTKGHFYILHESGEKILEQVDKDTLEKYISKYHMELSEIEESSKSYWSTNSNKIDVEEQRKTQES